MKSSDRSFENMQISMTSVMTFMAALAGVISFQFMHFDTKSDAEERSTGLRESQKDTEENIKELRKEMRENNKQVREELSQILYFVKSK